MPSVKSFLAAAALASLAQAKTITITATSDNKFDPDTVEAAKDDVLEFHFEPKNHSVVAGAYDVPCSPMQRDLDEAFFSGFLDTDDGEAVFRVTVNNTDPIAFYSAQSKECPGGMVGIINPADDKNLADFKDAAGKLASGVSPGREAYGGELADNDGSDGGDDGNDEEDNDGDDADSDSSEDGGDEGAAPGIRVPLVGLVVAVGAGFFLA